MRDTDDKKIKDFEFSFSLKTCTHCGYEAASVNELYRNYPKDKYDKKEGLKYLCKECYNAYMRVWNKNNPEHAKKQNANHVITRRLYKREYDKKYRFRTKIAYHAKAYTHIMCAFDKKFRKFHKVKDIDIRIPYDNIIKSDLYYNVTLYDLITHYLKNKKLDFDLYFYPFETKDRAYLFYIKLK